MPKVDSHGRHPRIGLPKNSPSWPAFGRLGSEFLADSIKFVVDSGGAEGTIDFGSSRHG
jgi:hypothetical protein